MRRLVSLTLALLLALSAASALARQAGGCCDDGCVDLTMCVTALCPACAAQAVEPAAPALPEPAAHAVPWRSGVVVAAAPAERVWRPPRNGGAFANQIP